MSQAVGGFNVLDKAEVNRARALDPEATLANLLTLVERFPLEVMENPAVPLLALEEPNLYKRVCFLARLALAQQGAPVEATFLTTYSAGGYGDMGTEGDMRMAMDGSGRSTDDQRSGHGGSDRGIEQEGEGSGNGDGWGSGCGQGRLVTSFMMKTVY